MNTLKSVVVAAVVMISATMSAQNKAVDASKSTIAWVGKKVTGKHDGSIKVKDGSLLFKKDKLAGGTINVDMSSIVVLDIPAGQGKEKLEGHLKADDFFGTEKHPTATIVFKSIGQKSPGVYAVTADLTIKGITNPVKFDMATTANSATTTLSIDRTKYDIKYGSKSFFDSIGDKAISDEFDLTVALKF